MKKQTSKTAILSRMIRIDDATMNRLRTAILGEHSAMFKDISDTTLIKIAIESTILHAVPIQPQLPL